MAFPARNILDIRPSAARPSTKEASCEQLQEQSQSTRTSTNIQSESNLVHCIPSIRPSTRNTTSGSAENHHLQDKDGSQKKSGSNHSCVGTSKPGAVHVRISPGGDFDKDLYVTYQSSSSSTKSFLVTGSSRGTNQSYSLGTQEDFIVPDSQSLPGSSSFVPTLSGSKDSNSANHSQIVGTVQLLSTLTSIASPPVGSSGLIIPDSNGSDTGSVGVTGSASHSSIPNPQILGPAPLLSFPEPLTSSSAHVQQQTYSSGTVSLSRHSQRTQEQSSLILDSQGTDQEIQIHVPGSIEEITSHQSSSITQCTEEHLILQTQLPSHTFSTETNGRDTSTCRFS